MSDYKNEIAKIAEIAEKVYLKGYWEGRGDIRKDEAYQKGLNDAWEAARKIAELNKSEQNTLFGVENPYPSQQTLEIFKNFSATEAIEKIKEYESHLPDKDVGEIKGLFIPNITAEMFRNGCLESIEALMAEGKLYDIECPREVLRQMKGASE